MDGLLAVIGGVFSWPVMLAILIGSFLGVLASLVFLVIDGHLLVIAAVVQSFELIPNSAEHSVVNPQNNAMAGSLMFMLARQISQPGLAAVLPMDGYHYDDMVLVPRGLRPRKTAAALNLSAPVITMLRHCRAKPTA